MRNVIFILLSYTLILPIIGENIFKEEEILPANEAFVVKKIINKNKIAVEWQIKKGYYLYSDSIKVESLETGLVNFDILDENKIMYTDPFFGETEIIKNKLIIQIKPEQNLKAKIEIHFQGCSESGFCYPMQKILIQS